MPTVNRASRAVVETVAPRSATWMFLSSYRAADRAGLVPNRYHGSVATNLRLSEQAAAAVKAEAERTGRSQQDVIRSAVDEYLAPPSARVVEAASGEGPSWRADLIPPKTPFRTVPLNKRITLPDGMTSLDLLDREDRI